MSEEAPSVQSNTNSTTQSSMLLENWGQAAAIVSGLTIASAVFYNWAYFSVAAPFAMQFLTIDDQISSALKWLPGVAVYYGIGAALSPFVPRKIIPGNPESAARNSMLVIIGSVLLCSIPFMLLLLYFVLAPSDWAPVIFPLAGLTFFVIRAFEVRGVSLPTPFLINTCLMLLILSLGFGNSYGLSDFVKTVGDVTLTTKSAGPTVSAVFLREMEKGVLLRNLDDHKIEFIPWENIDTLSFSYAALDTHSRICNDFKIFCNLTDPNLMPIK